VTDDRIREVLDIYERELADARLGPLHYAKQMVPQIRALLAELPALSRAGIDYEEAFAAYTDKSLRIAHQLGFLQGILWTKNRYSIHEIEAHNKPAEPPQPDTGATT